MKDLEEQRHEDLATGDRDREQRHRCVEHTERRRDGKCTGRQQALAGAAFGVDQQGGEDRGRAKAEDIPGQPRRHAAGRHAEHRRRQQHQLGQRQWHARRLVRAAFGQYACCQHREQYGDRDQRPERRPPHAQLRKDPPDGGTDQGGHPPHAGDQGHRPRPQGLGEGQPDHGVGQCEQQSATQPLDKPAREHDGHGRGKCADQRTAGKHQCRGNVRAPWSHARQPARRQRRAEDRRRDEECGVPGVIVEAADVLDHRGQDGGGDIDIDRMEHHAPSECERAHAIGPR